MYISEQEKLKWELYLSGRISADELFKEYVGINWEQEYVADFSPLSSLEILKASIEKMRNRF